MFNRKLKPISVTFLLLPVLGCTVVDTAALEGGQKVEIARKQKSNAVQITKVDDKIIPGSELYSNSNSYWGWQPPTNVYSPRYTHKLFK